MRILHVDDYFIPSLGYEAELAHEQLEMGHDVSFAASTLLPPAKGLSPVQRGESKVRAHLLWTLRAGRRHVWMPGIVRVLLAERPEVVHCHSVFDLTAVSLAILKPFFGYRMLYCAHTSDLNTRVTEDPMVARVYGGFKALAAPLIRMAADHVTAVGENEQAMVERWIGLPASKISIVRLATRLPGILDRTRKREDERRRLGLAPDDVAIVHVGTVTPPKRIEVLLEALAHPMLGTLPLRLLVLGGGSPDYIAGLRETAARLALTDRVVFTGRFVEKDEVFGTLLASDIACWPGAISIAAVEAMSGELPLILSAGDRYRDFLISRGNGVSFDGSPDALAGQLQSLAGDPGSRERMGKRSRALAESEFGLPAVAARFIELYGR